MIVLMVTLAGSNLLCALDCYQPAAFEVAHCHEAAPVADRQVTAGHDCAGHQVQTPVSPGRVEISKIVVAVLGRSVVIDSPGFEPLSAELRIRTAASPPGPTVIPLRI